MQKNEFSEMTDEELLAAAKKAKSAALINAVFIGFLIGIIVYSVANNTWGLVTLIPLYLIYRLTRNPHDTGELEKELQERNLL